MLDPSSQLVMPGYSQLQPSAPTASTTAGPASAGQQQRPQHPADCASSTVGYLQDPITSSEGHVVPDEGSPLLGSRATGCGRSSTPCRHLEQLTLALSTRPTSACPGSYHASVPIPITPGIHAGSSSGSCMVGPETMTTTPTSVTGHATSRPGLRRALTMTGNSPTTEGEGGLAESCEALGTSSGSYAGSALLRTAPNSIQKDSCFGSVTCMMTHSAPVSGQ